MEDLARGFVIHFTARSGSTFLIYTLRLHPLILARAEIFGNKMLPENKEQTADNQIAFLRKFWRNYRLSDKKNDNTARGFKVQMRHNNPHIKAFGRYAKVVLEYDVVKIFLYRRNHVKQIISSLRAQQVMDLQRTIGKQESAHVFDAETAEKVHCLPKLIVSPKNLNNRLLALKRSYKIMEKLKEKTGSDMDIYYEDVLLNRQEIFDKIFKLLNISSIDVTSRDEVKKITKENLFDIIENYEELLRYFSDTEYYAQLID